MRTLKQINGEGTLINDDVRRVRLFADAVLISLFPPSDISITSHPPCHQEVHIEMVKSCQIRTCRRQSLRQAASEGIHRGSPNPTGFDPARETSNCSRRAKDAKAVVLTMEPDTNVSIQEGSGCIIEIIQSR
ncbi:hypothetical protein Y032_0073g737 [Ancylostoma ceylanicum]|nr:hypothetical protein Y032_0073g737 [Ancylostoma ceylanicum]